MAPLFPSLLERMLSPRDVVLRHPGQLVRFAFLLSNFVRQSSSHRSSAAASESVPFARFAWHFEEHLSSLAAFEATLTSHLRTVGSAGMLPVSSPPKGVPGSQNIAPLFRSRIPFQNCRTESVTRQAAAGGTVSFEFEVSYFVLQSFSQLSSLVPGSTFPDAVNW